MSNFAFLQPEWPTLHDAAIKAESLAYPDSRASCFYARRGLEIFVQWLYKHDASLKLPYQDNLSALIHEPTFKAAVGPTVFAKTKLIKDLGNLAVHGNKKILDSDARIAVSELFHISYWLAHTYARGLKPLPGLAFDSNALPKTGLPKQTVEQLQRLETELRDRDEKLSSLLRDKTTLDEELQRLRAEITEAKKASVAQPDAHDYSEEQTRDYFIDLLLKEAGWALDKPEDREFQVNGMPNNQGIGFADYVLWGDDGKPLAVVEAKRTKRDPRVGQQQAKLYADCLEKQFGQRPVIFYTNGYEHWIWDDACYSPRKIQGFYKKPELELLIQRRESRKSLARGEINPKIVERYYQTRSIRRIGEAFERDYDRKALVVMATGAGKTRTVIALSDLLMRCNWAKRVLFLADRVALVNQAVNAFRSHLPDSSPVNLVTEKDAEGRVFISTYPTMMGLIDETKDNQKRFGVGHFDLIIIDEAHRSVFQKYKAIFDYFDSLLVGLTATPKDEVDRNTYGLFDLEDGVPTDTYSLDEAVKDKFLVPPKAVSVPLKFIREGIRYDDLSEEEKDQWDSVEWDDDGNVPSRVDSEAVNKWLFNKDTVDKALAHLMTHGLKVSGGDRLGKTILFAKNQDHADFITERFNINYPHFKGEFARTITFKTEYAQSLIDNFSIKDKAPHIAISVDMLDTGIDVPEVVNLVFFKLVHSKTKFWQMLGRGTRLCPDLFGPGKHKQFFYIFDYCQNLEYFSQNPETADAALNDSLGKRLFKTRLEIIRELDLRALSDPDGTLVKGSSGVTDEPTTELDVRHFITSDLRTEVAAMNLDNFIVRSKRLFVEKYTKPEPWALFSDESFSELAHEIAGLPSELEPEAEEPKRFDLLIYRLQLALMRSEPAFRKLRDQVRDIAGLLEEKSTIPMIRQQMTLIQELQSDEWWQDITIPLLELVRRRLRGLVKLIEKQKRKPIYTDFADEIGDAEIIELPGLKAGKDFEKFRAKARAFLREHIDHISIHKLRTNKPLTAKDLSELERMFTQNGVGEIEEINQAKKESESLGLFVRSLIGLDREAAKQAFGEFLIAKLVSANQIEFINLIVDYLTEHGVMDPSLLYESPFTDINPQGPEGIFSSTQVDQLIFILKNIRQRAA